MTIQRVRLFTTESSSLRDAYWSVHLIWYSFCLKSEAFPMIARFSNLYTATSCTVPTKAFLYARRCLAAPLDSPDADILTRLWQPQWFQTLAKVVWGKRCCHWEPLHPENLWICLSWSILHRIYRSRCWLSLCCEKFQKWPFKNAIHK
jgi:hypothetical protein